MGPGFLRVGKGEFPDMGTHGNHEKEQLDYTVSSLRNSLAERNLAGRKVMFFDISSALGPWLGLLEGVKDRNKSQEAEGRNME